MALIKSQIEAILNLFVVSFVNGCNDKERKELVIQFGDAFGKSIIYQINFMNKHKIYSPTLRLN